MLRNIPNKYTQNSLLEEIDAAGFAETYDFFYLPMDVHNRTNVGYAFVNFLLPVDMARFSATFTDYVFQKHTSLKIARVSPAHIQGLLENLSHFSTRAVTWSRNSQYRPIVKYQGMHRDLGVLLAELPPLEQQGHAPAPVEEDSVVSASPLGLNPEAAEFVPLLSTGPSCHTTFLRSDAESFVPHAVAPPPGLETQAAVLQGIFDLYYGCDAVAQEPVTMTPGICVSPGEDSSAVASESFAAAKMNLQEVVSKWLREEHGAPHSSVGGGSTRSSSHGTPRSVGTAGPEAKVFLDQF